MSGAGPSDALSGVVPRPRERRPLWVDTILLLTAGAVFVTLLGLGTWQLRRLDWKLALIDAVETRAFGPPVALPVGPVSAEEDAYLRVQTQGRWRHDLQRRVKAITELGPGHWLMTPLETADGTVWINRGFVPAGSAPEDWTAPAGERRVEGLIRMTEPGGTLLERNAPETGRWVSRDIAALSADVGLADGRLTDGGLTDAGRAGVGRAGARGFFVDADHAGAPQSWPRGGLTVVSFRNNHLSYALTWYAMAALFLGGMVYVVRERLRDRL
ncbi:MAG: SURF1 family protein [Pseudomonadota bacterium]